MPKILLALSVVFMLGSAILGFMNKPKLDEAQAAHAASESAKTAALNEVTASKKIVGETTAKLTAETAKTTELQQQITAKESEVTQAKSEAANLTAQLTQKTADLDAANAEKEKLVAAASAAPTATAEVNPVDNSAQITELNAQIEALKSEKALIGDKLVASESKANDAARKLDDIKNATMARGLEGQIVAVNQAWGFVVLNLGNRSGVVNNAEMVVMRGGDRVGKVKITSVEPSNSIADIQPDSVLAGNRILPGDRVIYSGK